MESTVEGSKGPTRAIRIEEHINIGSIEDVGDACSCMQRVGNLIVHHVIVQNSNLIVQRWWGFRRKLAVWLSVANVVHSDYNLD